jgi:hypothetical protein
MLLDIYEVSLVRIVLYIYITLHTYIHTLDTSHSYAVCTSSTHSLPVSPSQITVLYCKLF